MLNVAITLSAIFVIAQNIIAFLIIAKLFKKIQVQV